MYYYFNPFNKQYLFPEGFEKYELFNSFYQAYSFKGFVIWNLWQKSSFIRNLCIVEKPENIVPLDQLKSFLPVSSILAFNRGSKGDEQKITILGIDRITKEEFFIKFAESELAQKNVNNEALILNQLQHLKFVPKIDQHLIENDFTLIKTNVLKGERLFKQSVDEQLITILLQLKDQQINTSRKYNSTLPSCFAHGDFCPWNMMVQNNQLLVFDWEMAGNYPLGYDLFTYIFQTNFLLQSNKDLAAIISENKKMIDGYFKHFHTREWKSHLKEFARIKTDLEKEKKHGMLSQYQQLLVHTEKLCN